MSIAAEMRNRAPCAGPGLNLPFCPRAKGLHWGNALLMVLASDAAYEDELEGSVLNCAGFTADPRSIVALLKATSTQGFLARSESAVILAFRGTEGLIDWSVDALAAPIKDWPNQSGRIHAGFARVLDEVWDEIVGHLRQHRGPEHALWITGHSLGGALATLAAAKLRLLAAAKPADAFRFGVDGVYTFGQPRTGDTAFAKAFDRVFEGRMVRFVNGSDVVTHVPGPLTYRHVGTLIHLKGGGEYSEDPGVFKQIWDRIRDRAQRTLDSRAFNAVLSSCQDHFMKHYVESVSRVYGRKAHAASASLWESGRIPSM